PRPCRPLERLQQAACLLPVGEHEDRDGALGLRSDRRVGDRLAGWARRDRRRLLRDLDRLRERIADRGAAEPREAADLVEGRPNEGVVLGRRRRDLSLTREDYEPDLELLGDAVEEGADRGLRSAEP